MSISNGRRSLLLAALKRLRVWESLAVDLEYAPDDLRAAIPDRELPAETIAERERLERDVVRCAALFCGEDPIAVEMFADEPHDVENPYRIERVREAVTMFLGVPA